MEIMNLKVKFNYIFICDCIKRLYYYILIYYISSNFHLLIIRILCIFFFFNNKLILIQIQYCVITNTFQHDNYEEKNGDFLLVLNILNNFIFLKPINLTTMDIQIIIKVSYNLHKIFQRVKLRYYKSTFAFKTFSSY